MEINIEKSVENIIKMILADNNKNSENLVFDIDSKLREDFGLDSFNLAELTVHIEDLYGIDVFSDGVISTFGEIIEKLKNVEK